MSSKLLIAIINQEKEPEVVKLFEKADKHPVCLSGRGMASVMNFGNLFNFPGDRRTAVIVSASHEEAESFLKHFSEKMNFDAPGEGIAFYINIDGYIG